MRMVAGPNGSGKSTLVELLRSIGNIGAALPFCSRAFFFDNSALEMRFIAEYSNAKGFLHIADSLPSWFVAHVVNAV